MRSIARISIVGLTVIVVVSAAYFVGFGAGWALRQTSAAADTGAEAEGAALCGGVETPEEFSLFWEAWRIVEEDFYGALPTGGEFTHGAIGGVLDSLDDPHTFLVSASEAGDESISLTGFYEGIGTVVVEREGNIVVVSPIEGSPAQRAGIEPGDIIIAVDDAEITGLDIREVVKLIRGPRGTKVRLTLFRMGTPEPLELDIVRDRVGLPSVSSSMLGDSVGYIRISFFSQATGPELDRSIDRLKFAGAKGMVLDLRNNPGGLLEPATLDVASEFLADGVILYEQRVDSEISYLVRPGGLATDVPLVVLVNGGTASAPEIVAGALQDHGRAVLIGERTFGKGSIQVLHKLSDGSHLHVTVGSWLTPNGTDIDELGLTPDIELSLTEADRAAEKDPQLERALEYLATRI